MHPKHIATDIEVGYHQEGPTRSIPNLHTALRYKERIAYNKFRPKYD